MRSSIWPVAVYGSFLDKFLFPSCLSLRGEIRPMTRAAGEESNSPSKFIS